MKNTMKKITAIAVFVMIIAMFTAVTANAEEIEYIDIIDGSNIDWISTATSSNNYIEYIDIYDDSSIEYIDVYDDNIIFPVNDNSIQYIDVYENGVIIPSGTGAYNPYNGASYAYPNNTINAYTTFSIFKSPASESVKVGGKALFIAGAYNAQSVTWRLVSADGKTIISLPQGTFNNKMMSEVSQQAGDIFKNMYFKTFTDSKGRDNIQFFNIGSEANGWRLEAVYTGSNNTTLTTNSAVISVVQ